MIVQNEFFDILIEQSYQKQYGSVGSTKLVNSFLKTLIEYADLEKKIKLICKANKNEMINLLISLTKDQAIYIPRLARFLNQNTSQTVFEMKLTETKLKNFFDKILNKRYSRYQFMKWLKIENKFTQ